MSDTAPRGSGPPPGAEGPGVAGTSAAGAPPKKMSTGARVLFACLGLTVLGILGVAVALTIGGFALKRGAESLVATVEEQREAGEMLQRLQEDHPFEPPADGVVGEERLARFLAVTEDAWEEMRPLAEDLGDLRAAGGRRGGGLDGLREMASGARAMGGLARSRVALAEALEANGTSLSEYVWTGIQVDRAADAAEGGRAREGVPPANLELVQRHSGELPRLGTGDEADEGVVVAVAVLWGMADPSTWQAMGLDTLSAR